MQLYDKKKQMKLKNLKLILPNLKNLQILKQWQNTKHKLVIIQKEKSCSHGTALLIIKFLKEDNYAADFL
jgi:hypothetical protein